MKTKLPHPLIAPSLLSANFLELGKAVDMINESEADFIHCDVMDGMFVPNISFGLPVIEAISRVAEKPLDVHLMIEKPERYLEAFQKAGAQMLSVHYEASTHLHRTLDQIRKLGMQSGVVLNPHSPIELLTDIIGFCDFVLLMSVNPGFGGQTFIQSSIEKVKRLRNLIDERGLNVLIEVDGGVDRNTAPLLVQAGADILVAGNAIFKASSPKEEIKVLKNCVHGN
ncbi:MAG: ribulose-phosphate 3-epimerase [Bacteroidia bacterium]|jgi:ribulose-phosphate 3-epimerase|nr:ribulose-phosphate 3-epimerase [Bacteroidia bacterium]